MNQGQYRNRVSFGKRQEFIAIAELLRRGYDVYIPLVDDQQIDCVIRCRDGEYVELQIKSRSKDIAKKNAGLFSAMQIPNPRENYFFLFYSEHISKYWIFPSNELVEQASRNEKGKNKGKYNINLTSFSKKSGQVSPSKRYSQYISKFELLPI